MDDSLPFELRWAAASCQGTTSLISSNFNSKGLYLLNYIDDFMGVGSSHEDAQAHFTPLQGTLHDLRLV